MFTSGFRDIVLKSALFFVCSAIWASAAPDPFACCTSYAAHLSLKSG